MRKLLTTVLALLCATTVSAQSTPSMSSFALRGIFRIPSTITPPTSGMTWSSSRGTWFTLSNRGNGFDIQEINMPDDKNYHTDGKNGCVDGAGTVQTATNLTGRFSQKSSGTGAACNAVLVHDWGQFLTSANGGPVDYVHYDTYNIWWDDNQSRLFVSVGDFYDCSKNDTLYSIQLGAFPTVTVRGPWIFYWQAAGRELNCGEANTMFHEAPATLINSSTASILTQRGTGSGQLACPDATTCNNATVDVNGVAIHGQTRYLVSGIKQSGTAGQSSWGTELFLCNGPSDSTPALSHLLCNALIYWPETGHDVTDDLGQVHHGNIQTGSLMLRRDPYTIVFGTNANISVAGNPLDCSYPYGLYTQRTTGWAPGIGENGDVAGLAEWIDESDFKGVVFPITYSVGASWYGVGTAFSDDFEKSTGTIPSSYLNRPACDGIYSPFYGNVSWPISAISVQSSSTPCGAIGAGVSCISTSSPTTLSNGDTVYINTSNSTPVLDGPYTITKTDASNFTIPVAVTVAGKTGRVFPNIASATVTAISVQANSGAGCGAIGAGVSCVTTSAAHGFSTNDKVWFANTNSTPNLGVATVTVVDSTHFTVTYAVTQAGTAGVVFPINYFVQGVSPLAGTGGRWLQSWAFPVEGTNCGINGTGSRTGNNPCRYIYARRNGGKGYNSEYTVPTAMFYSNTDMLAAAGATYTNTRTATTCPGCIYYNVDQSSFDVFVAPSLISGSTCVDDGVTLCGMHPAANMINFQYNDLSDAYNVKTVRDYHFNGSVWRPTGDANGQARRWYVLSNSNQGAATSIVNVMDLSSCGASTPTAPTIGTVNALSSSSLRVHFTDNSSNEDNFNIIRCTGTCSGSASYTLAGTMGPNPPTCTDGVNSCFDDPGPLNASSTYTYQVQAVNCAGAGTSATANGTTTAGTNPPVNGNIRGLTKRD